MELNEIETKILKIEKINETKSSFFEKINKIDKHLPTLIKKKIEMTEINKERKKERKNQGKRIESVS